MIENFVFRAFYLAAFLLIILPLIVVIGTSFNPEGVLVFPPEGISLIWYQEFLQSSTWRAAFQSSILIGFGTVILAVPLGIMAAYGTIQLNVSYANFLVLLVILPLLMPPIVIAVALVFYFNQLGLYLTHLGVIFAHTLWAGPLVFIIMLAVFSRFDWNKRDAALDLGASPVQAFREVVYPETKPGILAGALLGFIISLQEFIMALFLTGHNSRTIPVVAWTALRQFVDPIISVVSTLLIALVLALLIPVVLFYSWDWIARRLG